MNETLVPSDSLEEGQDLPCSGPMLLGGLHAREQGGPSEWLDSNQHMLSFESNL